MPSSARTLYTQITSVVALTKVLYPASVLDRDTIACLQAHHVIKLGPRKMVKPLVERLSSTLPAQSAS
jgi:hypothetical protein